MLTLVWMPCHGRQLSYSYKCLGCTIVQIIVYTKEQNNLCSPFATTVVKTQVTIAMCSIESGATTVHWKSPHVTQITFTKLWEWHEVRDIHYIKVLQKLSSILWYHMIREVGQWYQRQSKQRGEYCDHSEVGKHHFNQTQNLVPMKINE